LTISVDLKNDQQVIWILTDFVKPENTRFRHSRESGNPEKWHSRGFTPIYGEDILNFRHFKL